jgi:RNA polymerase sigma-70 factor (ECF subfamily)
MNGHEHGSNNIGGTLPAPDANEAALIQAAQCGDLDAYNQLVLAHQSQVYNLAARILGDDAAADDATQQAFIAAYQHLNTFRGGSFKHWLLRTVTNACYDALRYQRRRPSVSLDDLGHSNANGDECDLDFDELIAAEAESPLASAECRDLRDAISRAIQRLPAEQRIVFVLADVQALSHQEVVEVTRWPIGTVKSRLFRARARLRDLLTQSGDLLPNT